MLFMNYCRENNVFFCDDSNLANRGEIIKKFYAAGMLHLSKDGTNVLASNFSHYLKEAFHIQAEEGHCSPPRYRKRPNSRSRKQKSGS